MSEDQSSPENDAKGAENDATQASIGFAEFLTSVPPAQFKKDVTGVHYEKRTAHGKGRLLITPDLTLHCSDCEGVRVFRFQDGVLYVGAGPNRKNYFLNYLCSNCQRGTKMYSLHIVIEDVASSNAHCYKFGEYPPYGDPTPPRLLRLFGKDSALFLKGRQCENHALGIGAFVYYRRVVENHKDQIFDEIIKVSKKIAPELVEKFTEAKKQQQFLAAIEAAKDAMPQALLIDGHNPLKLLHRALSKGVHAMTDDECLDLAHHVRIVLAELAERMGTIMKDDAHLKAAIAKLTEAD